MVTSHRSSPFADSGAPTPKRRKIFNSREDGPENDSGDDLSSEVATLPLNSSFVNVPQSPTQATQPTQILSPSSPAPVVQVVASSPFRNGHSSSASRNPSSVEPARRSDGPVKPLDFYFRRPSAPVINLSDEGPQYIGSSSDSEKSDHDIKPVSFSASAAKDGSRLTSGITSKREHSSSTPITKVEESPPSVSATNTASFKDIAKFKYTPTNGKSIMPKGRLDSVTRTPSFASTGSLSRSQRQPERAQPLVDIKVDEIENIEHRRQVIRMKTVLPSKTNRVLLNALIRKNGNYDDAMDALTTEDTPIDLSEEDVNNKNSAGVSKTSNRAIKASRATIKDKWSSTQARKSPVSSPPPVDIKARRKLVRSSNRNSVERSVSPMAITVDDDSDSAAEMEDDSEDERELEKRLLDYINTCTQNELADVACTTDEIAAAILAERPFRSIEEVRVVSNTSSNKKGRGRGARTRAIGDKVIDVCLETMRGYDAVDVLIKKVEDLGKPIAESIKKWGVDILGSNSEPGELHLTGLNTEDPDPSLKDSGIGTPTDIVDRGSGEEGEDDIKSSKRDKHAENFLESQPQNMAEGVVLKDYQLAGVSWLNLLYESKLSCILADEMGLGKTCQVIAFMAHLLSKGVVGPHLVVVPSSTLENWLREFANFCPDLKVEPYYGSQKERVDMRSNLLKDRSWNVLVTTYQLATGDKQDRGFLKNLSFNICVYDEGHLLKNSASNRYDALMKLPAEYRLLLTGTPLQNNLQELASLLAFILPKVFNEKREDLASIFKYKAKTSDSDESNNALLSAQRIQRARAMMTPFVLRRKKQHVLKHLPPKTQRVEYCTLAEQQRSIYEDQKSSAREAFKARANGKKPTKSSSNLMMQLRKAAMHPLLFRVHYTDDKIKKMSREIMKEEVYRKNDQAAILEDMEVMNDLELNRLCDDFPDSLSKFSLKHEEWMDSGKVEKMKELLLEMKSKNDRVLLFSQFTQVLDILELVLSTLDMGFLRIDGSTPVDARQDLIDQYHQEEDIMAFLLSTKAGGFGINLACANKVIIFDSSFNPHDDAQASDRAHRVGQTRPVEVIRLITKDTIEEQILQLANTKLALDESISADEKTIESKGEEMVAKLLLEAEEAKDP